MDCYYIVAMRLAQRQENAAALQQVLTASGCNIKARLGLHEVSGDYCANDGVIILQLCGDKAGIDSLMVELGKLDGVNAKLIDLN